MRLARSAGVRDCTSTVVEDGVDVDGRSPSPSPSPPLYVDVEPEKPVSKNTPRPPLALLSTADHVASWLAVQPDNDLM